MLTAEYTAKGLSVAAIGLIFPARAIGGILGNLLAGFGSDMRGRTRLVWLSALGLAASLTFVALATPWLLFLIALIAVGAAQGGLSTGINAMIADVNRTARARALNNLHAIYGLGAALSPLIFGYLLEGELPWRWALGGTALIWLLYGLGANRLDRAKTNVRQTERREPLNLRILRSPPILSLFAIAFIYNGVAYSLLGWITLFMQETIGFSIFASVSTISIFYVGLTAGRFVCAAYTERIGYANMLLILAGGIALTYPLVVASTNPALVVGGVFLTGLSVSGLFPIAMAYGSRLYPEQSGTLSGTLNVAMALGAMIPPLWTGLVASIWSFQVALALNYGMVLALLLIVPYLKQIEAPQGEQ